MPPVDEFFETVASQKYASNDNFYTNFCKKFTCRNWLLNKAMRNAVLDAWFSYLNKNPFEFYEFSNEKDFVIVSEGR